MLFADRLGIHGVVDFLNVGGQLDLLLALRIGGVERGAGTGGVAADHRHLFNDDVAAARLLNGGRSGKTRAACADDDDVRGEILRILGEGEFLFFLLGEVLQIRASLRERVGHGGDDRVGGVGRAGDGIDGDGLRLDDGARNGRDRGIADARGLAMLDNLNGQDALRIDGDGDLHGTVVAGGFAGVGAGGHALRHGGAKRHRQHERKREQKTQKFTHVFLPPHIQVNFCSDEKTISQ